MGAKWQSVDMRLLEEELEADVLSDYANMAKEALGDIETREYDRIDRRFPEPIEEGLDQFVGQLRSDVAFGISTRFLGASVILSTWAYYEKFVIQLAALVSRHRKSTLTLDDLRGSFSKRSERHFELLAWPLFEKPAERQLVLETQTIRNAFAHANGILSDVRPRTARNRLQGIAKPNSGVDIVSGVLVVTPKRAEVYWLAMKALTMKLKARLQADFPLAKSGP